MTDLQDTIVALATAPGPGARAIIRLSGPDAVGVVSQVVRTDELVRAGERRSYPGWAELPGLHALLDVMVYVWPAPRSYTGQDVVELHTISSPPVLELLIASLLRAGARAAGPGEFTLRAFLSGKLDLPKAEAVLGIIEAGSRDELRQALAQLAGGLSQPLTALRSELLDLLADVEAGLDFSEEDLQFVGQAELLGRLTKALALVTTVQKQLEQRALAQRPFRVVLAGRPNAGKSSLFNALTGADALVSSKPGTTRDYLVRRVEWHGVALELVDTAGRRDVAEEIEAQAQRLGQGQSGQADLLLVCIEAGEAPDCEEAACLSRPEPPAVRVATKSDLRRDGSGALSTSAHTGAGLEDVRALVAERARARPAAPLAPSLSRCRHHVQACLDHLRQAHASVLYEEPAELLAVELRGALDQLGEMVGAVYTDDLLERIFSRFCIGK